MEGGCHVFSRLQCDERRCMRIKALVVAMAVAVVMVDNGRKMKLERERGG